MSLHKDEMSLHKDEMSLVIKTKCHSLRLLLVFIIETEYNKDKKKGGLYNGERNCKASQ